MKFLVAFLLLNCLAFAISQRPSGGLFGFNEEQLKALADLDPAKLPKELKSKVGDASHWCCTNEQPVQLVQRTRVEKEIHIVATKVKVGYTSCGFAGWGMCTVYSTQYKQVAVYHIGTYEVPDESACLDHHVKCCKDYLLVAGNCFSFSTISENMDLISQLVNLGLITGKK